jgi:hypothetical protein
MAGNMAVKFFKSKPANLSFSTASEAVSIGNFVTVRSPPFLRSPFLLPPPGFNNQSSPKDGSSGRKSPQNLSAITNNNGSQSQSQLKGSADGSSLLNNCFLCTTPVTSADGSFFPEEAQNAPKRSPRPLSASYNNTNNSKLVPSGATAAGKPSVVFRLSPNPHVTALRSPISEGGGRVPTPPPWVFNPRDRTPLFFPVSPISRSSPLPLAISKDPTKQDGLLVQRGKKTYRGKPIPNTDYLMVFSP